MAENSMDHRKPPEPNWRILSVHFESNLSLSNIYILYITWFQQIHGEIREMAKVFFSGHTAVLWINLCSYQITTTKALALTKSHKPGASPRNEVVDGPNQVMCSVGRPGRDRCGLLQTSGPSGLHCRFGEILGVPQVAQGRKISCLPNEITGCLSSPEGEGRSSTCMKNRCATASTSCLRPCCESGSDSWYCASAIRNGIRDQKSERSWGMRWMW